MSNLAKKIKLPLTTELAEVLANTRFLMSKYGINEIEANHYGINHELLSNLCRLSWGFELVQSDFEYVFNEPIEDVIMINELMWNGIRKVEMLGYNFSTLIFTENLLYLRSGEWTGYYKQQRLEDLHNDFIHLCMGISTKNYPSYWVVNRMRRYSKEEYSENEANFVDEWTLVNSAENNKSLMECAADLKGVRGAYLEPRKDMKSFYQSYLNEKKNMLR
jgi:hypothetical protein